MTRARDGFDQIYNLDYEEAAQTFRDLREQFPGHPAPPLYLAIVTWLRELMLRQELDLRTFAAPGYFSKPTTRKMDRELRQSFFDWVGESRQICEAMLEKDPTNKDARYFLGSSHGILGSFAVTIDRNLRQALGHGRKAYKFHRDLLEQDSSFFDAYMTVGLYEYIVDNLPWYLKWLAIIVGYRGSEKRGLQYLQTAAEKAPFVSDDSRTLLMVLNVHEGHNAAALEDARWLHRKYPKNFILHLNQAQILERLGRKTAAVDEYQEVIRKAEAEIPNYQKLLLATFRYQAGETFLELNRADLAIEQFEESINATATPQDERVLSVLGLAKALDLSGRRAEALLHYQEVLKMAAVGNSHREARRYLKKPYGSGKKS